MNGFILLHKPCGITSNQLLQCVKRLYNVKKAGHTGSLDPLATGMLPIALGEATKFVAYGLNADKVYEATGLLGIKTDTSDASGQIVSSCTKVNISSQQLLAALETFKGNTLQIPSMFSALKSQGKALYTYARQGISIERQARLIHIQELNLLYYDCEKHIFKIKVLCSKGTYIRTLIENIGDKLRCGAHVAGLRRLSIGKFGPNSMVSLSELQQQTDLNELDKILLPIHLAVANYPKVELSETAQFYLRQGNSIIVPKAPTSGMVQLVGKNDRFIGVGEILENGKVAPRKLYQG